MNPGPLVFLAAFFAMATSWFGFVLAPQLQLGREEQEEVKETGALYPVRLSGLARQGEKVYRANGCFYCHTEQVRPQGWGADLDRWGARQSAVQSVAEDYLYHEPVMFGSQRVGPDLANLGVRQTNVVWLMAHLYDPQSTSKGSTMPRYRYLFEKRRAQIGQLNPDAIPVGDAPAGYDIVPTSDAKALVAYLLNLKADALLPETPPLPGSAAAKAAAAGATNAPAGGTNTPAGGTNSPGAGTNSPTPTGTNPPSK